MQLTHIADRSRLRLEWLNLLTDFFALAAGLSTLSLWLLYLGGGNFHQFRFAVIGSVALALLLAGLHSLKGSTTTLAHVEDGRSLKLTSLGWLAAGTAALAPLFSNKWLFWSILVVASALLLLATKREKCDFAGDNEPTSRPTQFDFACLLLLAISTVIVTIVSHRPDADDQYYVGSAMKLLANPEIPLNELRVNKLAYILTSYTAIIAVAADLSGAPFLWIYYLLAPAMMAFLSVFVAYRLFSEISDHGAVLATLLFVAVLICWGDMHRSPGNFAYVRLFQGKAVFFLVVVPLMLTYTIRVYKCYDPFAPSLLAASIIGGIGSTQSTVVLGPLFLLINVGFLFPNAFQFACNPLDRRALRVVCSNVARDVFHLLPIAVVLFLGATLLAIVEQVPQGYLAERISSEAVAYTLGNDWRAMIGFGCLFLLPFLVNTSLRLPFTALVIGTVVIFAPPFGALLSWFSSSIPWRITWIIPFVPAVALAISRLAQIGVWRDHPFRQLGLAALALASFAALGRSTLSPSNYVTLGWPRLKTENSGEILLRKLSKEHPFPIINDRVCLSKTHCY